MKHLKSINEYFSNINEGINYNTAVNADLEEIGYIVLQGSGKNPNDLTAEEAEKAATDAMKKASPIPLTGVMKKDLPAFLKYVLSSTETHLLIEGEYLLLSLTTQWRRRSRWPSPSRPACSCGARSSPAGATATATTTWWACSR